MLQRDCAAASLVALTLPVGLGAAFRAATELRAASAVGTAGATPSAAWARALGFGTATPVSPGGTQVLTCPDSSTDVGATPGSARPGWVRQHQRRSAWVSFPRE